MNETRGCLQNQLTRQIRVRVDAYTTFNDCSSNHCAKNLRSDVAHHLLPQRDLRSQRSRSRAPCPSSRAKSSAGCSCGQCCECQTGAGDRCCPASKNCCCCRILRPIGNCLEPIVCWPVHKICHLVNFCAPDGFVGPPDVMGPGRFHPVPTHPVFEPGPRPMMYPQPPAE